MQIWSAEIKELETLYSSIKGRFHELEKELEQLIKFDDANVIMLYSRRCLEVIITDLCECELKRPRKTEPLKGIIDKLRHEEKVPSHIITSMHGLNDLSTYGAHPKEFDPRQVRPVLINLVTVIEWYLKYKNKKNEVIGKERIEEFGHDEIDVKEKSFQIPKLKRNLFMIVSGIFVTGIVLIIVFNLLDFFRKDKFEAIRDPNGRISIAVMPFSNLTGDSVLNFWQSGISEFLINTLGTSNDLSVMSSQVMSEVFESIGQIQTASVLPSLAKEAANRVKAGIYITGNFLGAGSDFSIMVNLVNTKTGEVIWSNKAEGNLETDYRSLLDSLSNLVKDYLEIKVLEQ
jgi:TolB-like protein